MEKTTYALQLFDAYVDEIEEHMRKTGTYDSVPLAKGHLKGSQCQNPDMAGAKTFINDLKQHIKVQGLGYDCYYWNDERDAEEVINALQAAYKQMLSNQFTFFFDGTGWLRAVIGLVVVCKVFLSSACDAEITFFRDKWDLRGEQDHSEHIAFVLSEKVTDPEVYITGY